MSITRRVFLRNGALAVVGTAAMPSFLARAASGASEATNAKRLVVIFQRGAADGLNIVIPHAEASYYAMRPSINIPRSSVLISTASSDYIPRWLPYSRFGSSAILRSCMLRAHPIPRAPTSMRRISWNRARRV